MNTTATFCGDTLFAKPPAVVIEKTRILMEAGVKPEIAVYTDADVDNARPLPHRIGPLGRPPLPGGAPRSPWWQPHAQPSPDDTGPPPDR